MSQDLECPEVRVDDLEKPDPTLIEKEWGRGEAPRTTVTFKTPGISHKARKESPTEEMKRNGLSGEWNRHYTLAFIGRGKIHFYTCL